MVRVVVRVFVAGEGVGVSGMGWVLCGEEWEGDGCVEERREVVDWEWELYVLGDGGWEEVG